MTPYRISVKQQVSIPLLLEKHRHLLFKNAPKKFRPFTGIPCLCIYAEKNGEQAGLLVAAVLRGQAEILSVFVAENHRRKGLGKALVAVLERNLKEINADIVCVQYQTDWTGTQILQKILTSSGWSPPEQEFLLCKGDLKAMFLKSDWLKNLPPLKKEVNLIPWHTLTEANILEVKSINFPNALSPFQMPDKIAYNSLAVKREGKLKGWLITHHTQTAIQYTSLYIEKEFDRGLLAMHLIREAGRIQLARGDNMALFMIHTENQPMIRLFERKFSEYCSFHEFIVKSCKNLHP